MERQHYLLILQALDVANTGANTVTLTATDVNSNVSAATATITVLDTIKPLISNCVAQISFQQRLMWELDVQQLLLGLLPTAADNCQVDSLVSSHNPGDVFALGTTTVTYTLHMILQ